MTVTLVTVLCVGLMVTRAIELEVVEEAPPRPRLARMPAIFDAMAAACEEAFSVEVEVEVEVVDVGDGVAVMVTSSVVTCCCSVPAWPGMTKLGAMLIAGCC